MFFSTSSQNSIRYKPGEKFPLYKEAFSHPAFFGEKTDPQTDPPRVCRLTLKLFPGLWLDSDPPSFVDICGIFWLTMRSFRFCNPTFEPSRHSKFLRYVVSLEIKYFYSNWISLLGVARRTESSLSVGRVLLQCTGLWCDSDAIVALRSGCVEARCMTSLVPEWATFTGSMSPTKCLLAPAWQE